MSKASKPCGYTGHMHITNKKNVTKTAYNSIISKAHGFDHSQVPEHPHHKSAYPEEKCTCASTPLKK